MSAADVTIEELSARLRAAEETIRALREGGPPQGAAEARITLLSRMYRALSETSEAIIRARDEGELLDRVCDVALRLGGFCLVWIGVHDAGQDALLAKAAAGTLADVVLGTAFSLDPTLPFGRTPAAAAFREGRAVVNNDYGEERSGAFERECAVRGVRSAVALPLRRCGRIKGALAIAAAEPGRFDAEVVALLERMALDVSFGLDGLGQAAALRESEERLRAVFEQAATGIAEVHPKTGRFLRINQRFCDMVGYSRDELLAMGWQRITHPDDVAADATSVARLASREATEFSREKRYLHKDGSAVWASVSVSVVRDPSGQARSAIVVAEDATRRKVAEAALRASEDRYRSLVENMDDVVFAGRPDGTITFVNDAIRRFGFAPEEIIGGSMRRLVHPDDVERVLEGMEHVLRGQAGTIEYRLRDAAGTYHFVRSTRRPQIEHGQEVGITGVVTDLTRQRELEERLHVAQKMEAIGRLAGGVAHDFNNLLGVIGSYTGFALGALPESSQAARDLGEVRKAARRAEELTRQLLAFGKKQLLQPEVIDLNALVDGTAKMLQRLIGEDIELVFTPAEGLGATRADPGQIEQVLLNLALNARDAMPGGGKLTIATANAEPEHGTATSPQVALTVADTGSGMDAATRSRLFEPFFTTKGPGKGTGLGLATAYGIVQQSGGTISVSSEVGTGTAFTILLPRVSATTAGAPYPRRPLEGTETVLDLE